MNDAILPVLDYYDLVLVNTPAKDYASNERRYIYERMIPPLGLGYIATYLTKMGFNVGIIDAEQRRLSISSVVSSINEASPKYVGISCLTPNFDVSKMIIERLKNKTNVVVGGPHIIDDLKEFLDEFPYVIAVRGFGEQPMLEILENRAAKSRIITNYYIDSNVLDMILDRSFFYASTTNDYGLTEAAMITSRGCYKKCSFCIGGHVPFRYRSMESVITELNELINRYNVKLIHFLDNMAFPSNRRLKRFIDGIKRSGLHGRFYWRGLLSIEALQRINIDSLQESGCVRLSIGVESGSNKILDLLNKPHHAEDVIHVLKTINRAGIRLKLFFMIGLPFETLEDVDKTRHLINLCKEFEVVDEINVFQYKPYPGTELFNKYYCATPIRYVYEDLRERVAKGDMSDDSYFKVVKTLGKDFYFCEHPLLSFSLKDIQEMIIDIVTDFYK